ncbi:probable aminopeptidase NPEPL1 isoform X2 [Oncorhynchus nerka]|uniref:probable aminopeptidase NPEPL1 isoform X2 n=1 Tax=Oncorhynchus nerka TaxID=8023 RepID=UPI001130CF19|nr:probable aminopeptidase NPEPL1 isoform X2 [Oncorhynchus nerka]
MQEIEAVGTELGITPVIIPGEEMKQKGFGGRTPQAPVPASIGSHLGFDWPGVWVHVDIASPVHAGERNTDFGVALLMALFGQASDDPMLNLVSPLGAATMNAASRDPMELDCKWRRLV